MNINAAVINKSIDKSKLYFLGVLFIFACAQIFIPIKPIPITLQTVAIMSIAFIYNLKDGIRTYFLYLIAGAAGIPLFSGFNSGIDIIFGQRFGYWTGFLFAILIMNYFKEKIGMNSIYKIFINCLAGSFMIYFFGILWLSSFYGFKQALIVGLVPFIIPGIVKSVLLSGIIKLVKRY